MNRNEMKIGMVVLLSRGICVTSTLNVDDNLYAEMRPPWQKYLMVDVIKEFFFWYKVPDLHCIIVLSKILSPGVQPISHYNSNVFVNFLPMTGWMFANTSLWISCRKERDFWGKISSSEEGWLVKGDFGGLTIWFQVQGTASSGCWKMFQKSQLFSLFSFSNVHLYCSSFHVARSCFPLRLLLCSWSVINTHLFSTTIYASDQAWLLF